MRPIQVEQELKRLHLTDAEVPWWKLALLRFETNPMHPLYKHKKRAEEGRRNPDDADIWIPELQTVVEMANKAFPEEMDTYIHQIPLECRWAALSSARAFCQFTKLIDDDLEPVVLKDFQVIAIRNMRERLLCEVLLPFAHGKSWLSSIVVPLMDWAENEEATELRIYQNQDWVKDWTTKLMDIVENHEPLHRLFPWVSRPIDTDPNYKTWSTKGFAISGKKVVGPSFRGVTVGAKRVGGRADRIGCDDWVTEANCTSMSQQDKLIRYFNTSAMTSRRERTNWGSKHNTKWGTCYLIGTIFDRRDINYRVMQTWRERIRRGDQTLRVLRFAIYPRRDSREFGEVIWPEKRSYQYVKQLEEDLQPEAFRMRCMNLPISTGDIRFSPTLVQQAISDDYQWGVIPQGLKKLLLGYDPAVGDRSKAAKYPAAVLMGFGPHWETHFIKWARFTGSQPDQVRQIAEWCRNYGCTVVVEDNATQKSYKDWLSEYAPDVHVLLHHTGSNKHNRDDGVESFIPLFQAGKVVIHGMNTPKSSLAELTGEFLDWPQGRYTDLIMAAWFAKYKWMELNRGQGREASQRVPELVRTYTRRRGLVRVYDLSRFH